MRVLVTGATGFLGRLVAARLVCEGDSVRALSRSGGQAALSGVEWVHGDLSQAGDIEAAVRGADAVVHCGARVATSGPWKEFAAVNIEATGRLITAAVEQGVQRVVHVSSLSVYSIPHDNAVIAEDSSYEDGAAERGFYSRSKLAADRVAMGAAARGAPVTTVRPGVLYGVGRRPPLGRRAFAAGPRRIILGSPDYLLPLTFGENAADAILLALHHPKAHGRAFTVVDPQVPLHEYLSLYRSISGATWQPVFVPGALLVPVAAAASLALRLAGRASPVTPHQIRRSTWSARFDCVRARQELGWTPRVSLADGLRRSLGEEAAAAAATPSESRYSNEAN